MKQHKGKILAVALLLFVLTAAFFWGGNYAGGSTYDGPDVWAAAPQAAVAENLQEKPPAYTPHMVEAKEEEIPPSSPISGKQAGDETAGQDTQQEKPEKSQEEPVEGVSGASLAYSEERGMTIEPETGKDKYLTDPVPAGRPVPMEPRNASRGDTAYTCTISVRCDTLLDNMAWLDKEKAELVPADGVILPAAKVTFYEGESVFNVLQREMKRNRIHLEFMNTPIYNSAYIEGINNLYEFDAGELSGWMYKVNGWFPNYGCSRYQLKDGDVVEWVYTVDLGRDVGGYVAGGGQQTNDQP